MSRTTVLAIGRSGLLFDAIDAIADSGRYRVAAVITDEAYDEYDVGISDFEAQAARVGAEFIATSTVTATLTGELSRRHGIDVGVSANWRYLIPGDVLASVPQGILNLHLGRLPDFKGNATANWAILTGEPAIYADVHKMAEDLDAGDVLARAELKLDDDTYISDVLDWTRRQAPHLFLAALDSAQSRPDECVTRGSAHGLRCYPRRPEDGAIDWTRQASDICRLVRASGRPYPGAFGHYRGKDLIVWRASVVPDAPPHLAVPGQVLGIDKTAGTVDVACGRDVLRLLEVEVDKRSARPPEVIRGLRARLESGRASAPRHSADTREAPST